MISILTDAALRHEGNSHAVRPDSEADAEYRVLTTAAGRDLLAEVAHARRPSPGDVARWRRSYAIDEVAAAIRLVESRRRGAAKFERADAMWLDPVGLEQSTAEPVARHKAARFAGSVAFDLCSGIGGDSVALAEVAGCVVAVDLDEGMAHRVRWNAEVYGVGHRLAPILGRAEAVAIPPEALVHIDPDRRVRAHGRARSVDDYVPGLGFLRQLPSRCRGGAIKLGPASDFAHAFGDLPVEIELITHAGECKEATVWFGDLATPGVRRRASRSADGATWTDRDGPGTSLAPTADRPGPWVFDPGPSLVRAGLVDGFAVAHGLARIGGSDFLTGPDRVASPFLAPFEVDETLPLDLKRLRRAVADRRLGPLEIKTRGLDLLPEELRKTLRPDGPNPATLLLVGGRGPSLAIVARRG
ncbi:MAG TPA: class I SAM-dependent methyltransferase [Isosphaeraceae bacterium]